MKEAWPQAHVSGGKKEAGAQYFPLKSLGGCVNTPCGHKSLPFRLLVTVWTHTVKEMLH